MNQFSKKLASGFDVLSDKMDQWGGLVEKKFNDGFSGSSASPSASASPTFATGSSDSVAGVGEVYQIGDKRYRVTKLIAEGGFAFVFLAEDTMGGRTVALKRVLIQDDHHLAVVKREIDILKRLNGHERIIPLLGASSSKRAGRTEMLILTEFCPGGSLLDLMYRRERNRLSEVEIRSILRDVAEAILHMHSQEPPIAHRDIKVENVLVSAGGTLQLCDFGSATTTTYDLSDTAQRNEADADINRNTTLLSRAPEMADLYCGQVIDERVDIWALGCLLYKLMFYADAFESRLGIISAKVNIPEESTYSQGLHDIVRFLLTANPDERPDIWDVLQRLGSPVQRPASRPARTKSKSKSKSKSGSKSTSRSKPEREVPKEKRPSPVPTLNTTPVVDGGLFSMLEWHTNENGPAGQGAQKQEVEITHRPSPRRRPNNKSASTTTDEFFAAFDSAPAASSLASSTPTSVHVSSPFFPDDSWGDFTGPTPTATATATPTLAAPAPMRSSGLSDLELALFGDSNSASPAASPSIGARTASPAGSGGAGSPSLNSGNRSQDILNLYGQQQQRSGSPGLAAPGSGSGMVMQGGVYYAAGMPMQPGVTYMSMPPAPGSPHMATMQMPMMQQPMLAPSSPMMQHRTPSPLSASATTSSGSMQQQQQQRTLGGSAPARSSPQQQKDPFADLSAGMFKGN